MIKLVDVYQYEGAKDILYDLLKERSTEDDKHVNISHRALPRYEQHEGFFYAHPYYVWCLVIEDVPGPGECVGSVHITKRNEIGIVLFKKHRGKGMGRMALRELIRGYPPQPEIRSERPGHFVANINPNNEASIKLFTGLGARHIQNTYQFD